MDSKKESDKEKRSNGHISSYRYLADTVKEISKIVLPSAEQTRASFKALSDSASRAANNIVSLYSPNNFSKELAIMADEMSQTLKKCLSDSITASHDALEGMVGQIADMQKEQVQKVLEIDFSSIFSSMIKSIEECTFHNLRDVVDTVYEEVQENGGFVEDADSFSEKEVREAIDVQINNPKEFPQKAKEWSKEKMLRYYIIWKLICFLYSNFLQPYFQQNVGVPVTAWVVSNVKELPQKGSEVICQIKEGVEAVIIENTNYYYKVSFIDENGVEQEGYVAKKNLKLIKQNEEDAEESEKIEEDKVDEK